MAFRLLILLLAAIPALAIANHALAQNTIAFAAAIILAMAAKGPRGDISTAGQIVKHFSLAILFPVIWMAVQIAPSLFPSLANSIWSAASIALSEPSLPGRVSIDPGATIQALFVYMTLLSLIVCTTIISREKKRAETILIVLSTVTTFISAEVLIGKIDAFESMSLSAGTAESATFVAMAMFSALVNGAILMMVMEGYLSRRDLQNSSLAPLVFRLALAVAGIAISLAAMNVLAPSGNLTAMVFGSAVVFFVAIVRRLGFQPWPSIILFVAFGGIAAAIAIPRFQNSPSSGIAGFAASATTESLALAQRALSDTPLLGNGVGTFKSLGPVYQDFGTAPVLQPPSTTILITIGWGQPALVILVAVAVQLFVFTFLGAIRRGRDSFFSSLAAASILAALLEAFLDSSLLSPTVQIIMATIIGLGLAQSVGRRAGLG